MPIPQEERRALRWGVLLSIGIVLVSGLLEARGNLRHVLSGFRYSLSSSEIDALFYVAPLYCGLAVLLALLLAYEDARSRLFGTVATGVLVVVALAHSFGLLSLVDRTPSHFPWEFMSAVGVLSVVGVGVSIFRSRHADPTKRWGFLLVAQAILLLPLSIYFVAIDRFFVPYVTHWVGHASLCVLALQWVRGRGVPSRWLSAGLILVGIATLPCWPGLVTSRSIYSDRETCGYEPTFGSLWEIWHQGDPVCSNLPGQALALGEIVVAIAGVVALAVWARRSR
jgi:hypothetical protein